jgi:hypothetical protein
MADESPTRRRWFQVTVRRLIDAALWTSVTVAAYCLTRWWKAPDSNPLLLFAIVAALTISPFIAFGTLLGHRLRGLLVGITLVGVYAIAICIAINFGWVPFP